MSRPASRKYPCLSPTSMKVLFQKPRCATATFNVSADAVGAAAIELSSSARMVRMRFSVPVRLAQARACRRSILSNVLFPHHAAPTGELVSQQPAEFSARHRRWDCAGLHELFTHIRHVKGADHRVVELGDDCRRCLGGSE